MRTAAPLPEFKRVSAALHRTLGLLPGWTFFHVPPRAALACSLCGRVAAYVTSIGTPKCEKHVRDF